MRRSSALVFLFTFGLLSICAFSQGSTLRFGVPPLDGGTNKISATDAQNRLIRALNQQKGSNKRQERSIAIPLEAKAGSKALTEAREKNCQLVLAVKLVELRSSVTVVNNGPAAIGEAPLFAASLEYRLIRTTDGISAVLGSLTAEDSWRVIQTLGHGDG